MTTNEKEILSSQLTKIYELMKQLPNSKVEGTTEYKVIFELENINMKFNIPFND